MSKPTKRQLEIKAKYGSCLPDTLISTANEPDGPDDPCFNLLNKIKDPKSSKRLKKINLKILDLIEYIQEYNIDMEKLESLYPYNYNALKDMLETE